MLLLALVLAQGPRVVALQPGMIITRSVLVVPKTYQFSRGSPPIVIRGDNITVDFRGAVLEGISPDSAPDFATDTAIVIEGGNAVRVENARIRGYKVGILARRTRRLVLAGNDVSDNWKPRLFSLIEHESLVDWLSFHHNENREWLRFGAAIYLEEADSTELRGNVALRGMNGVLLVRSHGVMLHDNNISFNSGLGIGLYRSSDNTIVHNRLDYNVRGYSHRFYSRGQDSADLLLFEQSCRNTVAYNSLTHGGDGVFLWAGQTTMDSGSGGANDNLFYGNDVSYATANGVEITFSRNRVMANRAWGSEYGVWGGYSFETEISDNDFKGNRTGIAIEHGQDNMITGNRFDEDSTAIRLWADSIEPSDWGYPKHHDTRSRDYRIVGNEFVGNRTRLNVRNTAGLDTTSATPHQPRPSVITRLSSDSMTFPASDLSRRDRASIIVDEWGPYDYSTPKLWPPWPPAGDSSRANSLKLVTLGPRGRWLVVSERGAGLSRNIGDIGDTIAVLPRADSVDDWEVTLESHGVRFSYGRFEPRIDWTVRMLDSTRVLPRLDFLWYRPPAAYAFLPQNNWSLSATGTVDLPRGIYSLRTISDDAVRVWIDDVLAIDNWTPHESQVDYAPLPAGKHELRVEYRQVDGWVELRVDIVRGSARSPGSPGPH
ncbi:MAG TPA: NosD domain-containing protein [Gemmatimonadales bacterium]|nr:NosD domain-containing protein [Gemmatimonadales bacterium]